MSVYGGIDMHRKRSQVALIARLGRLIHPAYPDLSSHHRLPPHPEVPLLVRWLAAANPVSSLSSHDAPFRARAPSVPKPRRSEAEPLWKAAAQCCT
jgi:hypothetical protein